MSDDGMRYRGHSKEETSKPIFATSKKSDDYLDEAGSLSKANNDANKSLLANNSFDPTTGRDLDRDGDGDGDGDGDDQTALMGNRNGSAGASSFACSSPSRSGADDDGILTTLAVLARKVRCKFLDKVPIGFASKFAVPPPPDHRVGLLRRFIADHVQNVAAANAAEQGLPPRTRTHADMIRTLWARLNTRAPRCVRRKVGEEDADICPEKCTGRVWGLVGFQGVDPATDFRGAGSLAIEHLLYFATHYPRLLEKIAETPPEHAPVSANYPFAIASINVSMLLLDMIKSVAHGPLGHKDPSQAPAAGSAAAKSAGHTATTTGAFHVGSYSAMEARRKLAHFLTDPGPSWLPPGSPGAAAAPAAAATTSSSFGSPNSASAAAPRLPWIHRHFRDNAAAMDEIFGDDDGGDSKNTTSSKASASVGELGIAQSPKTQEEQELEMVAERLAAVHVAACCVLHDQWQRSKRNVIYFNDVFKQTAARLELLFRDSGTFEQVMKEVWREE